RQRDVGAGTDDHRRERTARKTGNQMKAALTRRDGFTLIETLAALAVGSVVIIATAALIRNVSLNFDRGARSVSETERIALAVERLAADFASDRFVTRATAGGSEVAVRRDRAALERQEGILFGANSQGHAGLTG